MMPGSWVHLSPRKEAIVSFPEAHPEFPQLLDHNTAVQKEGHQLSFHSIDDPLNTGPKQSEMALLRRCVTLGV